MMIDYTRYGDAHRQDSGGSGGLFGGGTGPDRGWPLHATNLMEADMTLLERTQAVLDDLDTGCTLTETRADLEALRGELVRRESTPPPTMLAPTAADHRLMALAEARPRRWFGLRRSS